MTTMMEKEDNDDNKDSNIHAKITSEALAEESVQARGESDAGACYASAIRLAAGTSRELSLPRKILNISFPFLIYKMQCQ